MPSRKRSFIGYRAVCGFCVFLVFYSSAASGLHAMVTATADWALQFKPRPGHFTEAPRPVYRGSNPKREPRTRGGMWSEQALAAAEKSQRKRAPLLWASLSPQEEEPSHTIATEAEPGGAMPWEGSAPTSGGTVNTGNGNKLTELPLVRWKDRGGMVVDFTLYHNSQTTYNDELGKGWTWTYDIYINYETEGVAIVHWGDGTSIPFSESGGNYTAPAGIYDTLVKNQDFTWALTAKDGTVYKFSNKGFCNEIEDRNGNKITLTLNSANYCTRITGPSGRYIDITLSGTNFASIEDPLGREWTFDIHGSNDTLTDVEHPELDESTYTDAFTYDASGRILTHTDKRGKVWTNTYNSDGSLATEKTPLNHTTSYTYTSSATTITLPGSQTVVHNYSSGKLASVVDSASFSESYTWNGSNQRTQKVDRRGKTWAYTYDSKGNVLTLTNPLSKVWTYTYNSFSQVLTEEDPLDNVTTYTYDGDGNLLTVEDPLTRETTYTYDAYGQVLTAENAEEEVTTFTYDTDGNLETIEDALENLTTMAYDDLGRVTSVTDPNGNCESFTHDAWGRVTLVTHEDDTDVATEYNANGQVTSVTNERGKTTTYAYDDSGRLTSVTNAKSEVESYAYNSNGWRTSVTNGRNKTRNYTYTARGEVYTLTLPDSSVETWSYNGNGQVSAYTNPLNQTINYTYDNASQQTGIDYPAGTDTSFAYDDAGRRTSMVDSTGTTSWTYNDASEVTAFDPPQGLVEYTYDLAGRRATMDEDGVGVTTYTYNAGGRLVNLENPHSEETDFTYDAGGRLTRKDLESGAYETTTYDTRNRVTQVLLKNSSNSTLRTQSWTYDDGSNVATMTQGGVTTTYGYDDIDQLTSESRSGYSATYTYDANGNRATRTIGGTTENYTYDDADKLDYIQVGGNTTKDYSYDAAGRTTSVAVTGVGTTTLAYDYEGRVTTITYPSTATNTFTYNGLDTRVSKVDSTGTRTYLRDGAGVTAPVLSDGAASYTPGTSEKRSGTTTYTHAGFKNGESQTGSGQTVLATKTFDAFGNLDTSSGTWKGPFGYGGPHGYQSDPDSGLMLLGHRYYDSSTGRFLTRDPVKDGRNWYVYCDSNPVTFADSTGMFKVWIFLGEGGTGWGVIIADPGDLIPPMPGHQGPPLKAEGGEIVHRFPISNRVPNPGASPGKVGGGGPMPPGYHPITGIEGPDRGGKDKGMGGQYPVTRKPGDPAGDRGTWVHGGKGDDWYHPTLGCVRCKQGDVDHICNLWDINKGNGNEHAIVVVNWPNGWPWIGPQPPKKKK